MITRTLLLIAVEDGLSTGALIGIIVGSVAGALLLGILLTLTIIVLVKATSHKQSTSAAYYTKG